VAALPGVPDYISKSVSIAKADIKSFDQGESLIPGCYRDHPILLTGTCFWRCRVCYGPEYDRPGALSATQWLMWFAGFWIPLGAETVTVSGGDPAARQDLLTLVGGLKLLPRRLVVPGQDPVDLPALHVTLSTSGGMGKRKLIHRPRVIEYADRLGVPLDGDTPESHGAVRLTISGRPATQNWHDVIELLWLLATEFPHKEVVIRSVVTRQSWEPLRRLPAKLAALGLPIDRWEWALYEPNFRSGPRQNIPARAELELPAGVFGEFLELPEVQASGFAKVTPHWVHQAAGHYAFLNPDGHMYVELTDPKIGIRSVYLGRVDTTTYKGMTIDTEI
jgi:hypothetical protein